MPVSASSKLKAQAYETIKDRIMDNIYSPGERININALSAELGINKAHLKDAVSTLEKEGLIVDSSAGYAQVVVLNSSVFKETFDIIYMILLGSYEFCLKENLIGQLVPLMSESIDYQRVVAPSGSNREFAEATIAVDQSMLVACKNQTIFDMYSGTFGIQTLLLIHDYESRPYDRMGNIHEHENILQAIASNDSDQARRLLRQHYNRSILFQH